jgi:formylglycine-generating enzyme required for sulfatase activity
MRLIIDAPLCEAAQLRSAALHLSDLAQNPMLLTVMAVVHTYKGTLPRERARLYNDCVELMLWNWQRHKQSGSGSWELGILHELNTREERLVNGLCEVAFQVHLSQETGIGPANIAEGEVVRILRRYLDGDWEKAQRFCGYVERQSGLLIGKGSDPNGERMYAFPHRGFQEFLAARHLVSSRDFARRVAELAEKGDVWREVLMLAIGHLVYNQQEVVLPLDAMNLLCKPEPPTTDTGWRAVWWAAEMMHIVGYAAAEQDEYVGKTLVQRLIAQLTKLISEGHLSARERAQAADVLGLLGDPRPGVCATSPDMVRIPASEVEIGADAERHKVALPSYALSRYPITNAQFRTFVNEGYHKRAYWTELGWAWREKNGQRQGLLEDPAWGIDNRPVVAVTWYEAAAYARWLAARTRKPFRLPTEAEWERAAAGIERRKYPWGNRTSDETANHRDTGIGQTTPVGIFEQDCTPEGICDMGGNVWEWCSSLNMDYPYRADDGREDLDAPGSRILRGGAFDNPRTVLHCTHRRNAEPRARVALIGFRVAVSEK